MAGGHISKIICVAQAGQTLDKTDVHNQCDFQIHEVWQSDDGRAVYMLSPQPKSSISLSVSNVDVFVLDENAPPPKLLLADMDSTIVTSETLDDLAAHFDMQEDVAKITERAMRGEMDFHEALEKRVQMLTGLPEQAIFDFLPKIETSPGAESLIYMCREKGIKPYLVSSGFTHVTEYIASKLGFEGHFGNRFVVEDGELTGAVQKPIQDKSAKLRILHELCDTHDSLPDEVIAIGDGANDIPMLQAAGYGIAYKAKPKVMDATALHIHYTDLSSLKYLFS